MEQFIVLCDVVCHQNTCWSHHLLHLVLWLKTDLLLLQIRHGFSAFLGLACGDKLAQYSSCLNRNGVTVYKTFNMEILSPQTRYTALDPVSGKIYYSPTLFKKTALTVYISLLSCTHFTKIIRLILGSSYDTHGVNINQYRILVVNLEERGICRRIITEEILNKWEVKMWIGSTGSWQGPICGLAWTQWWTFVFIKNRDFLDQLFKEDYHADDLTRDFLTQGENNSLWRRVSPSHGSFKINRMFAIHVFPSQ
jgi:hypothetical protein